MLFLGASHRTAFALLALPAAATLLALAVARRRYPHPEHAGPAPARLTRRGRLVLYTLFAALTVAGFAHFSLISYHATVRAVLSDPAVPLFFAIATGVSAASALAAGLAFDRFGLRSVLFVPPLTAALGPLVFSDSALSLALGLVLWGVVLGVQESTIRAAVARLVAPGSRGRSPSASLRGTSST